ncbi:MAG: phosphatidylserine decarboxylase family protein [Deltaproteobacteria bacterium]|nr:phosphatidylserine decarboxylase family protein [Deltaproteobacteria bacterium]
MIPVAQDAWSYLWKIALLLVIAGLFGSATLVWLLVLAGAFVLFFFRDPERDVPFDRTLAISPADGKVLRINELVEEEFIGGPAVKVSIFLSIFNVHVNRSPITGTVLFHKYRAGKMLPAFKSHASEENERNTIGIEGQGVRVLVHQITGFIARRIVCRVSPGDQLMQGQRFGLIKFGSCTEIVLPATAQVLVREGDFVKGGETPIARI